MMHDRHQANVLVAREARLATNGVLLVLLQSGTAILRNVSWSALQHGHFASYSSPTLIDMAARLFLVERGSCPSTAEPY